VRARISHHLTGLGWGRCATLGVLGSACWEARPGPSVRGHSVERGARAFLRPLGAVCPFVLFRGFSPLVSLAAPRNPVRAPRFFEGQLVLTSAMSSFVPFHALLVNFFPFGQLFRFSFVNQSSGSPPGGDRLVDLVALRAIDLCIASGRSVSALEEKTALIVVGASTRVSKFSNLHSLLLSSNSSSNHHDSSASSLLLRLSLSHWTRTDLPGASGIEALVASSSCLLNKPGNGTTPLPPECSRLVSVSSCTPPLFSFLSRTLLPFRVSFPSSRSSFPRRRHGPSSPGADAHVFSPGHGLHDRVPLESCTAR